MLDGESSRGFEYDKVRALLSYLAIEAGQPHRREALAGLLWPDQAENMARNSLRTALSKLRQATGDRSADPPFFEISRETIQFNQASDYRLDVGDFASLIEACERHNHRRLDTCQKCAGRQEKAAALYRGDFLIGFSLADSPAFEDWVVFRREQWHRQALNALYHLAAFYERRAEYARAYQYAGQQISLEHRPQIPPQPLLTLRVLCSRRQRAVPSRKNARLSRPSLLQIAHRRSDRKRQCPRVRSP